MGLLERVPQHINERPPFYKGRDDLETLMASPNCGDWIKLRYGIISTDCELVMVNSYN